MPAETRKSNGEANFKAYYAKKPPKQVYFPHRRKIVKRRVDDVEKEKTQMKFLPEKMRMARDAVQDSEGEEETEGQHEQDEGDEEPQPHKRTGREKATRQPNGRGRKRDSNAIAQDDEGEPGAATALPAPKRRRQPAKPAKPPKPAKTAKTAKPVKNRKHESAAIPSVLAARHDELAHRSPALRASSEPESESERERDRKSRRRRQSTMTQLVDGRRPGPGDKEPEFKPVNRRTSRNSWGNGRGKARDKDKQQRTLTQMVRGMVPPSDSDEDEDEDGGVEIDTTLAEHLAQSGLFEAAGAPPITGHTGTSTSLPTGEGGVRERAATHPEVVPQIVDEDDTDDGEEYRPTQNVLSPEKRTRPTRRGTSRVTDPPTNQSEAKPTLSKTIKKRFSLLATPERRRVLEIPSSQSPADTPLSTKSTPRSHRRPLSERTANTQKVLETPSKRKRVAFQDDVTEIQRPPPARRQFVQDSEYEDDALDDDEENEEPDLEKAIGPETQRAIYNIEHPVTGRNIGSETQAMLEQIDRACEDAEEFELMVGREDSIELGSSGNGHVDEGGSQTIRFGRRKSEVPDLAMDQEDAADEDSPTPQVAPQASLQQHELAATNPSPQTPAPRSSHFTNPPPSAVVIKEEPSTQPYLTSATPKHQRPPTPTQNLIDLDGHPINTPRSLTPETQTSHSSKAEQQLQSELFLSYSQYPPPMPPSSSMAVLGVGSDSYMHVMETPRKAGVEAMQAAAADPRWEATSLSQATTVDADVFTQRSPAVTPKKNTEAAVTTAWTPTRVTPRNPTMRTGIALTTPTTPRIRSAFATPHSSRTLSGSKTPQKLVPSTPTRETTTQISPQRPDTLVIPSSFPSPGKLSWCNQSDGASGFGMADDGLESVEDFSIPGLPPVMADWEDEDEL